jgi:GH15 family glucan-1,4-alpha-glucosidase
MGKDYGVGMDYFISICRYFGNGLEWSDEMFNQRPKPVNETIDPNIEFDGFGLFLWVFSEYVKKCKDIDFLKDNIDKLKLTGENILGLIDKEVNLIKKDSSIWESHLVLAKHYLYTSITSAKGLKELAALCGLVDEDASKYIEGYNILIQGIKSNTDKNGYLKGSFEEKVRYYDAAVVEAINFDLVDDYIGTKTIKGFEDKLYNGKGFKRTDNVGTYDRMEWIFINLRIASAYLKYGERQKALNLIDRTQNIAKVNYNIIHELYDGNDGCAGQIPMMGYGAAAFINALYSLANN